MQRAKSGGRQSVIIGRLGESIVGFWLRLHGFSVLQRNFRGGGGELDIVARRGQLLLVVEVKTSRDLIFDRLIGRLTARQRLRMVGATNAYIRQSKCRFTSIEFALACVKWGYFPRVRVLRDAFRAEDVYPVSWDDQSLG